MKRVLCLILCLTLLLCCGCGASEQELPAETQTAEQDQLPHEQEPAESAVQEQTEEEVPAMEEPVEEEIPAVSHVVVIDPGHQITGNFEQEPNGPGSSEMKNKVSSGTQGQFTGLPEYELNLQVGLQLRDELEARGYTVYMTRETNEVDISNVERAQFAGEVGGEILVRIHANGSNDPSVSGAMTICQTPSNPYQNQYEASRLLSDCVLAEYCAATGMIPEMVWETDTMTGINWAEIPSTIVEMGYMTNQSDDTQMADPEFQKLIVQGIANGIDRYFSELAE